MDTFRSLVFFVAVFFSGSSFAVVESVAPVSAPLYRWQSIFGGASGFTYPTAAAACAGYASAYPSYAGGVYAAAPLPGCYYDKNSTSFLLGWSGASSTAPAVCPVPSSGDAYTFNASTGQCERAGPACVAGTVSGFSLPAASSPATMCSSGCETEVLSASDQFQIGGVQSWVGTSISTGKTCTGGNVSASTAGAASAPSTSPHNFNGQTPYPTCSGEMTGPTSCPDGESLVKQGCMASCTNTIPKTDTQNAATAAAGANAAAAASTAAAGQTAATAAAEKTNADNLRAVADALAATAKAAGGTDPAANRAADNANSAAVVAAVNANREAVKANSLAQMCRDNPALNICQTNQITANCGAFTCSGDAIQCAMAKQQNDDRCQLINEKNPQLDIGNAMISGTDVSAPNPADKVNRSILSIGSLDASTPYAASCPQDVTFSVMGNSASIPLSVWCPYLAFVGNVFLALSFVAAARIIGGV